MIVVEPSSFLVTFGVRADFRLVISGRSVDFSHTCRVIFFSKDKFDEILTQYPIIKHRLLRVLCDRIRFIEMRTKNMLYY